MIEVRQGDRIAAAKLFRTDWAAKECLEGNRDDDERVQLFAAHRQQAEDAMKERCAKLAKVATCGCDITERDSKGWPTTLTGAARHMADYIEQQIRGIDTTQAKEAG